MSLDPWRGILSDVHISPLRTVNDVSPNPSRPVFGKEAQWQPPDRDQEPVSSWLQAALLATT